MNKYLKLTVDFKLQPSRHAGLTLIEILMTIFVLAIGLLGVAALMPVGSYQMQRGQIAQRVSEIGPSALDLLEASNMHSPSRWYDRVNDQHFDDVELYGSSEWVRKAHTSTASVAAVAESGSGNHLLEFIRSDDATKLGQYHAPGTTVEPSSNDVCVARRCEPFAIDPLYMYQVGMNPFVSASKDPYGTGDAMPRITVSGVDRQAAAEAIFQNDEDLTLNRDLDEDGTEDEIEDWQRAALSDSAGAVLKAKSEGNYSWLATFSPGETATGSDPKQWTVSVAVFYKRPLGLGADSQWTVPFSASGGNNGYTTVTLSPTSSNQIFEGNGTNFDQDAGDKMKIKRRMWGLVTFTDDGHKRARWYRVGTVQKPPNGNNNIKIRLIGPDLPSDFSAKITFFEGLEGVFTRAMRAEELPVGHVPLPPPPP